MVEPLSSPTPRLVERTCSSNKEQRSLHKKLPSKSAHASRGIWVFLAVFLLTVICLAQVAHAGDTDQGFREYSYAEVKQRPSEIDWNRPAQKI